MAIHNRHDFHAFSAFGGADFCPTTFGHNKGRVDEAFFLVQRASVAKLVGNIGQNSTQDLIAAPSLKPPMHSFIVRMALRKHVPLRACVEYPQHRFKHTTGWNWLAAGSTIGDMLFRKMIPDAFHRPQIVASSPCADREIELAIAEANMMDTGEG